MGNNLGMPTWKCPKCGCSETYQGTELQQKVTGSGGGSSIGFIGNELGDSGIAPMMGRSQRINVDSRTVEVTVRKCKKCDTLLGDKDEYFTPEEIAAIKASRQKADAREAEIKYAVEKDENFYKFILRSAFGMILILWFLMYLATDYEWINALIPLVIAVFIVPPIGWVMWKFKKWASASLKKQTASTRFKCPNCASRNYTQKFEVPNELLGSKIECPKCKIEFLAK